MYWYNKNRDDMEKKKSKDRECNDENCNDMAIREPGVFCSAVSISSFLLQCIKHFLSMSQRREGEIWKNRIAIDISHCLFYTKSTQNWFFSLLLLYSRFELKKYCAKKRLKKHDSK